jgi:hypothetical protein
VKAERGVPWNRWNTWNTDKMLSPIYLIIFVIFDKKLALSFTII